jgi:hypothetical protein
MKKEEEVVVLANKYSCTGLIRLFLNAESTEQQALAIGYRKTVSGSIILKKLIEEMERWWK